MWGCEKIGEITVTNSRSEFTKDYQPPDCIELSGNNANVDVVYLSFTNK